MSNQIDPDVVLKMLADDVPRALQANLLLAGSLAAAYHHRDGAHRSVLTKDADLVVHPAGAIAECAVIATELLRAKWRAEKRMQPGDASAANDALSIIRLCPPAHDAYFVELLGMPRSDQTERKRWERVELRGTSVDGFYVVPCFRYMALFENDQRKVVDLDIAYASPPLMALANLLSHPKIGPEKIGDTNTNRSAKDLGRAVTLFWLAGTERRSWSAIMSHALHDHFGSEANELAQRAPDGVRALLANPEALAQAFDLADSGLLLGRGVKREAYEATATELIATLDELSEM